MQVTRHTILSAALRDLPCLVILVLWPLGWLGSLGKRLMVGKRAIARVGPTESPARGGAIVQLPRIFDSPVDPWIKPL